MRFLFLSTGLIVTFQWLSLKGAESVAESGWFSLNLDPRPSIADSASFAYTDWLSTFFVYDEFFNLDLVAEESDPDIDGSTNHFEFLSKLDPTDTNDRFIISFTGDSDEFLRFSPLKEGVNFEIQLSTDLETWLKADPNFYQQDGNQVQINLQSFSENTFYRIRLLESSP